MPELTNSNFGTDLKAIIAGIVDAIREAWPDVVKVHVDRNIIEDPTTPRAVIVPGGVNMISGGSDPGSSTIKTVLQQFSFSIFLIERITEGADIIGDKIDRADALIDELMASSQFLGTYELPMVPRVELAEEEPDMKRTVLQIDFEVQCLNWKHGAVV